MRITSLASGSAGNAYCVEHGGAALMVDCGLSCRELSKRCKAADIDVSKIAAVVFTHNHADHVKGLATFHARRPDVELYANMMTADAIACVTGVEDFCIFENGQRFEAAGFSVKAFSIPHDVPDPVGFLVGAGGCTYFHATDVGAPLDSIGVNFAEADYATLEFNHDPLMLASSARPESLKSRIRGARGHLSNGDAAELAAKFASGRLKVLALAHLSEECNAPHLALAAAKEALAASGKSGVGIVALEQSAFVRIADGSQEGGA